MSKSARPEIHYKDAAEVVTVTGWACKTCGRYWGRDEHMARYCCATSMLCECGQRHDKGWTKCRACRDKVDFDRWFAKPAIEWDGEFPVATWDSDHYFFDEDSLLEHIYDHFGEDMDTEDWSGIRLTTCRPTVTPSFDMNEFLCDNLPEDSELDADEINKTVNDWIAAQGVISWEPTGQRLDTESVKARLFAKDSK